MYKLTAFTGIIRIADGACIPSDPANTDYVAYLAWIAEGNTPEPADLPDPKKVIRAEIAYLEQSQLMPRAIREFMLLSLESMATPEQLAFHHGYQAVKAFDAQVTALRSQL